MKPVENYPHHILFTLRHDSGRKGWFVLLAGIVGLITGCGAFALKWLTAVISRAVTAGLQADSIPWRFLILPLAGIIIVGCFQQYILRRNIDHGTDRINEALTTRRYLLPLTSTFGPIIASAITLGMGGSAGSEGPIAYAGASIGSRLGHFFRLSPKHMAAIVAIGAGAGIAAIFKAPVGGMFFALEVLTISLGPISTVALVVACLTAGMTAYTLSGFTPDLSFTAVPAFSPVLLAWALPLGIICGFYARFYSGVMNRLTRFYEAIRHPWLKWTLSGAALAIMVFLFPALFGEGYKAIGEILDGRGAAALGYAGVVNLIPGLTPAMKVMILAGGIALVKSFATASTNSGGGVAGDFAPTIFAGAILGFFLVAVAEALGLALAPAAIVFMAMGGVMAGAVRAPLMAMFLVAETTGAFSLFMPLALTSAISYLILRLLTR